MKKLFAALTLPLLFSFSNPGSSDNVIHIDYNNEYDIGGTYRNACTGEDVLFTGTVEYNVKGVINGNSGNISTHNRFRAEGVGTQRQIRIALNNRTPFPRH